METREKNGLGKTNENGNRIEKQKQSINGETKQNWAQRIAENGKGRRKAI